LATEIREETDRGSALPVRLEDLAFASVLLTAEHEILFCNAPFHALIAEGNADSAPLLLEALIHPEDVAIVRAKLTVVGTASGPARSAEIRLRVGGSHFQTYQVAFCPVESPGAPLILAQFAEASPAPDLALAKAEERWNSALVSAGCGVWDHNLVTNETFYSDMWRQIRGLEADDPVPQSLEDVLADIHPDDRANVIGSVVRQRVGIETSVIFQYRCRHKKGHWIWIECRGACVTRGPDGEPLRIIGTDIDITTRKFSEKTLEMMSRRLKLALDTSGIGVFEADFDLGTAEWDDGMFRVYGLGEKSEVRIGGLWEAMLHPDDKDRVFAKVDHHVANLIPFSDEFRVTFSDGSEHFIRSRTVPFIDGDGHRKMIGANWDVTADLALQRDLAQAKGIAEARNRDLEAAKQQIEHIALHDPLTNLPNRRYLDEMIGRIEAECKSNGIAIAVLHFDLDRFKEINDTHGHHAGDVLLQYTARVLRDCMAPTDFVARIGGDEFVAIVRFDGAEEQLAQLSGRVIEKMRKPVTINGVECRTGISIGIAYDSGAEVDVRRLLLDADIALYQSKKLGRNRVEFFSHDTHIGMIAAKQIADEILVGLERDEFVPFYQLQFDAETLEIAGVETLARWRHPERGLLTPDKFLGIAEDLDITAEIDHLIFKKAMADCALWDRAGLIMPKCSVNVSSRRLRDPNLKTHLQLAPDEAQRFSFELLESIFLDEVDGQIAENLALIRSLGINIEVDDFGTGHASIMGLLRLRPTALKIDRQLIRTIDVSVEQRQLVGSIIDMGHSLGVKATAEGVETDQHVAILKALGCDTLQGFGLAKPMPADEVIGFVRGRSWFFAQSSSGRPDSRKSPLSLQRAPWGE
jgi:diguanylate cyclase (GGDEF)-like protein/PAS domain S-box-containing protein